MQKLQVSVNRNCLPGLLVTYNDVLQLLIFELLVGDFDLSIRAGSCSFATQALTDRGLMKSSEI